LTPSISAHDIGTLLDGRKSGCQCLRPNARLTRLIAQITQANREGVGRAPDSGHAGKKRRHQDNNQLFIHETFRSVCARETHELLTIPARLCDGKRCRSAFERDRGIYFARKNLPVT
jgi:hypothetical protein